MNAWIQNVFVMSACGLALCLNAVEQKIEQPHYRVLTKDQNFELRVYEPCLIAEVTVYGSFDQSMKQGERILTRYQRSGNVQRTSIAKTIPFGQQMGLEEEDLSSVALPHRQNWRIALPLPSEYHLNTLPEPLDNRIQLKKLPLSQVAVLTFEGNLTEHLGQAKLKELKQYIKNYHLKPLKNPVFVKYSSFTHQKNEVLVVIEPIVLTDKFKQ